MPRGPPQLLLDLRRTRVGEWDPAVLRRLAVGRPGDALLAVLDEQGMNGLPTPGSAADWPRQIALGDEPMSRGVHGHDAVARSEQFLTGERPFLGWAATMGATGGTGTNFDTDPAIARGVANASQQLMPLFAPFGPMRQFLDQRFGAVLTGYLRPGAVVVE